MGRMPVRQFRTTQVLHAERDLYEILDVSNDASANEIRSAFLKMARKYHPDMNKTPGANKIFAEVNEAYETLSNPTKREIYDSTGMSSNE